MGNLILHNESFSIKLVLANSNLSIKSKNTCTLALLKATKSTEQAFAMS